VQGLGVTVLFNAAGTQVRPPSSVRHTAENIECVTQPWVASVNEMASRAGSVKACLSHVTPPSAVENRP
jgi:hypothetical protein